MEREPEDGYTLAEVIIAVAIMAVAVAGILGGLSTAVATSALHRNQATAEAIHVSASESLKQAAYRECATTSDATYLAALQAVDRPSGWPAPEITAVQHWDGSAFVNYSAPCPASPADQLQRITLQIRGPSPDDRVFEKDLSVIKRDQT